jgi:hypothetical protein
MTKEQALDFIAQIVQGASMPLAGHQQAQKALAVLKELIDKKEEK